MPNKVLVICSANMCRSPMAEGYLAKIIDEYEIPDLEVKSAALFFHGGNYASKGASQTAQRNGFCLEKHRSTKIDRELFDWADTVFAMTYEHVTHLETFYNGDCKDKVILLGSFSSSYNPSTPALLRKYWIHLAAQ